MFFFSLSLAMLTTLIGPSQKNKIESFGHSQIIMIEVLPFGSHLYKL
jgi:hypothetical protein